MATRQGAEVVLAHPQLGELRLNREKLAVGGTDGIMLVVYHPDAGGAAAEKLALLGSAALPASAPRVDPTPSKQS